jgi:DNA-binding NarL/FixJ family response regulator
MRRPTLLIVDDHATFRATARALLEIDGWEVVGEAGDGSTGIAAAADLNPDVVLLDVRLPDMNGFDGGARRSSAPVHRARTRRRCAPRRR